MDYWKDLARRIKKYLPSGRLLAWAWFAGSIYTIHVLIIGLIFDKHTVGVFFMPEAVHFEPWFFAALISVFICLFEFLIIDDYLEFAKKGKRKKHD